MQNMTEETPSDSFHWIWRCIACRFTNTAPIASLVRLVKNWVDPGADYSRTDSAYDLGLPAEPRLIPVSNQVDQAPVLGSTKDLQETSGDCDMMSGQNWKEKKGGFVESAELPDIRGLMNNGNTCFFNATFQALSQCHTLTQILDLHIQGQKGVTIPAPVCRNTNDGGDKPSLGSLKIDLPESEGLLQVLARQVKLMLTASPLRGPVNPSTLFVQLCQRAWVFRGGDQHDAQELLRHLLDQVRVEESKRYQQGVTEALQTSTLFEDHQDSKNQVKIKTRAYMRRVSQNTIADWVFGGQFVNTIVCEDCNHTSQKIEPFLDISLPIYDEKVLRHWGDQDCDLDTDSVNTCFPSSSSGRKKRDNNKVAKGRGATGITRPKSISLKETHSNNKKLNLRRKSKSLCSPDNSSLSFMADILMEESVMMTEASSEWGFSNNDYEDNEDAVSMNSVRSGASDDSGMLMPTPGKSPVPPEDTTCTGATSQMSQNSQDSGWASMDASNASPDTASLNNGTADQGTSKLLEQINEKMVGLSLSEVNEDKARIIWLASCLASVGPRKHWKSGENLNIDVLLSHFTSPEVMSGSNKVVCQNCNNKEFTEDNFSDYDDGQSEVSIETNKKLHLSNASRQALILIPPAVLTLHLKRFEQTGAFSLRKVTKQVDFPFLLDLSPYCAAPSQVLGRETKTKERFTYSLFGVVEHLGSLKAGHYVAYVKVRRAHTLDEVKTILNTNVDMDIESHFKNYFAQLQSESMSDRVSLMETHTAAADDIPGVWYYASDSQTSRVSPEKVAKAQAYLLFYERVI